MHILFFTKGDQSVASSRQRVWRVADRLQKQYGLLFYVVHGLYYSFFSLSFNRFKVFFSIISKIQDTRYKILFVHKSFFPWDVVLSVLAAKIFFRKKLVYDLDDAEWIHSPRKSAMLAKHADVVFCGSHEILSWAQHYNKNSIFVPTALDVELYGSYAVAHEQKEQLTIGWVGQGKAHFKAGNFAVLKDALIKLHEKHIEFRFVIAGAQNYQPLHVFFSNVPFEVVFIDEADWLKEEAVPSIIQKYSFDIGVMPLADTLFNRAKCAFKALEYLACGVPVVASPVGEANYVVKNDINGYLAETSEEWVLAMEKLLKDVVLRKHMGEAGQKRIQEQYAYQKLIPQIHMELGKLVIL